MRIFITLLYINAQNLTEHSVDEIVHHVHHKGQSREFTLDKLRQRSYIEYLIHQGGSRDHPRPLNIDI